MARARRGPARNRPAAEPPAADAGALLAGAVERRWRRVLDELARNRRRCTEEAVHDLRVSMRRLIAAVDLAAAVVPGDGPAGIRRTLRRHLRAFNDLRDVHVQLLAVAPMVRRFPALAPVAADLRRRERVLVRAAARRIAGLATGALEECVRELQVSLAALFARPTMTSVGRTALLGALATAFARASERRQAVNAADPRTIHRLRVAFKNVRYMQEILRPLLPGVGRGELKAMQAFQTSMGDIQDAGVLARTVGAFAARRRTRAGPSLVPLQQHLAQRQRVLVDAFLSSADDLYRFWSAGPPRRRARV